MSYSFGANATKDDIGDALREQATAALEGQNFPDDEEDGSNPAKLAFEEHLSFAIAAVEKAARVIGEDGATLQVSISGHANPGHVPTEGWADETMNIAISRVG